MIFNATGASGGSIKLDTITIIHQPKRTDYTAGESFERDGLAIQATYTNGAAKTVENYTVIPAGALHFGTESVTIVYSEGGTTARQIISISVERAATDVPVQRETLTYNGEPQSPEWDNYDPSAMSMEGGDPQVDAGTYSATFTLDNDHEWTNGGTEPKTIEWNIERADCDLTVQPESVILSPDLLTTSIKVSRKGDGPVSAQTMAPNIVDAQLDGDTITVTSKDGKSGKADITVTVDATKNYNGGRIVVPVRAVFVQIYGVVWDYGNSSTALTRLTPDNDPQQYVNTTIKGTPSPAVGTGEGTSPFDDLAPWSGMEEYNISESKIIKSGENGFSRTNDTMVYIPPFYFAVIDDADSKKRYYYIADGQMEGFEKHPGSGRYVARYDTSSGARSITGAAPQVNTSRTDFRTQAKAKGAGWQLLDFISWCAVVLLYLVEFADWNSQEVLGYGYVDSSNSATISAGKTDSMTYHTGTAGTAITDGKHAVQYRNIENLWGNVSQWVDGNMFVDRAAWICADPAKYGDTTANHTQAGVTLSGPGKIILLGISEAFSWAIIPSNAFTMNDSVYIPDNVYCASGTCAMNVGGVWNNGTNAGLLCISFTNAPSYTSKSTGARLLYDPAAAAAGNDMVVTKSEEAGHE